MPLSTLTTFDKINRVISVSTNSTSITIQQLYDDVIDFFDEPNNMDLDPILTAAGKDDIGGGEFVGVTVALINDWRLSFGDRSSADNVIACSVTGGNLVATNTFGDNPIFPTLFTQIQTRQSQAPTLLEAADAGGAQIG